MRIQGVRKYSAISVALAAAAIFPSRGWAHCDSLEGPVVREARMALDKGDPAPLLKWVSREQEAEVRSAFAQARAVRGKGEDVRAVADRYFFETVVRLHRMAEGEMFVGLKPFGMTDPAIAAAEKAMQSGSAEELTGRISANVSAAIQKRFADVLEKKKHAASSVEAGRRYVKAYVDYIHFVESLDQLASGAAPNPHP